MENSNNGIAFIETRGMTALTAALDNMLKGANIKLLAYHVYGSAYLTAAIAGSDDDLLNAISIGKKAVEDLAKNNPAHAIAEAGISQIITTHIISNPLIDIINTFFKKKEIKSDNNNALGFIDARGLVSLIAAADLMTKSTNVEILGYYEMGSGRLSMLISGQIDSLSYAIEEGLEIVKEHGELISHCVIASPSSELIEIL